MGTKTSSYSKNCEQKKSEHTVRGSKFEHTLAFYKPLWPYSGAPTATRRGRTNHCCMDTGFVPSTILSLYHLPDLLTLQEQFWGLSRRPPPQRACSRPQRPAALAWFSLVQSSMQYKGAQSYKTITFKASMIHYTMDNHGVSALLPWNWPAVSGDFLPAAWDLLSSLIYFQRSITRSFLCFFSLQWIVLNKRPLFRRSCCH